MYSTRNSTSEGNRIVFLFITMHPNGGRMKRVRLPQSKMQTVVACGQDPYVAKEFPSPNEVPVPSDSL